MRKAKVPFFNTIKTENVGNTPYVGICGLEIVNCLGGRSLTELGRRENKF